MKRQSTTVKITAEIVSLLSDYITPTKGVIVRHRGTEYGVVGIWRKFGGVNLLATREGVALNPSECTILKTTLATIAQYTGYIVDIVRKSTGFTCGSDILDSHILYSYVPTINGSHWHHFAIIQLCTELGIPVFRHGRYTCESMWSQNDAALMCAQADL